LQVPHQIEDLRLYRNVERRGPPALAKARPELCTDAPGFDRGTFHQQFDADVLAFFRAQLGDR
jgi:hypothetical protein